jgi:hypothetical protein
MWPRRGVIVVEGSLSPDCAVKLKGDSVHDERFNWDPARDRVPDLKHWSDVVFLSWKQAISRVEGDIENLKWIVQRQVDNDETYKVIMHVLRNLPRSNKHEVEVPVIPITQTITRDQTEVGFNMLLATPPVRGVVWMLAQHRAALGNKWISSIEVYAESASLRREPTLRIRIKDVSCEQLDELKRSNDT